MNVVKIIETPRLETVTVRVDPRIMRIVRELSKAQGFGHAQFIRTSILQKLINEGILSSDRLEELAHGE